LASDTNQSDYRLLLLLFQKIASIHTADFNYFSKTKCA